MVAETGGAAVVGVEVEVEDAAAVDGEVAVTGVAVIRRAEGDTGGAGTGEAGEGVYSIEAGVGGVLFLRGKGVMGECFGSW